VVEDFQADFGREGGEEREGSWVLWGLRHFEKLNLFEEAEMWPALSFAMLNNDNDIRRKQTERGSAGG